MHPAEQLFDLLYAGTSGFLELRTFDHSDAQQLRQFVEVRMGAYDFAPIRAFLEATEQRKLGAFFGVALRSANGAKQKKGTGEHCQCLPALFVDADFKHLGEEITRQRLREFKLPPSIVVNSGGGLHPYWKLATALALQGPGQMDRAKSVLRRLAHAVGDVVDESVSEPARVLRIPGSFNFKKCYPEPRRVVLETL
jgi:putative DNA primase/helicase